MGQLPDESYCIGNHHVQSIADRQQAAGGIQGVKQPVIRGDPRICQSVKESRLPSIGVAHDGHHRNLILHPALTLGAPDPSDLLQLLFQLVNFPVDVPPVRLQLGLTGALGTNRAFAAGTRLALQVGPHTRQSGQQILILGQLHLKASFTGSGPLGKNVQNQGAAVQHLDLQILCEGPHLGRTQVVVKDDHGGLLVDHQLPDLRHLALADKRTGLRRKAVLQHQSCHFASRRLHQGRQLLQGVLIGVVPLIQLGTAQPHQHRPIPGFL